MVQRGGHGEERGVWPDGAMASEAVLRVAGACQRWKA
jgi:hypothetical protein